MAFKFEKLKVWQKAIALSLHIHELTREFPKEELYVLTAQIKRAADSIALNIAEGSTGQTNKEFRQFVGYAIRSAIEVVSCLYLGRERGVVRGGRFATLYTETEDVVRMLQALKNVLN